jgi:hypothetical protein
LIIFGSLFFAILAAFMFRDKTPAAKAPTIELKQLAPTASSAAPPQ